MLKHIKKFVLDSLPSVVATIVGAYIVHHYVIPAATPKNPAAAVANVDPKPDASKSEPAQADKPSFTKGVAEKAAIEKAAEKASEKASESAPAESKKRHATPRKAVVPDQTASVPDTPGSDERRDANDLARAAIERLRSSEPARSGEPARTVATQAALPALPPTVTVAPPSSEVFTAGAGAIVGPARPAQSTLPMRSADASKPTPPAEIPRPAPIELHGDVGPAGRAATVADDMMSAAKSVFHAVLPR